MSRTPPWAKGLLLVPMDTPRHLQKRLIFRRPESRPIPSGKHRSGRPFHVRQKGRNHMSMSKYNAAGYPDPTAHEALTMIRGNRKLFEPSGPSSTSALPMR